MPNPLESFLQFLKDGDLQKAARLDHITPAEKDHLFKVYSALLAGIMVAGVGTFSGNLVMRQNLLGPAGLSILGVILCIFASYRVSAAVNLSSPASKGISTEGAAYFGLASFASGLSMTGIVVYAAVLHAQILVSALVSAGVIFASLSLASLFARRRSMLFLGGVVGSLAGYLLMASLINMFIPTLLLTNVITLGGLLVALGYTLADTQTMLERSSLGDSMVLSHALQLYMDFVNLFLYILRKKLDREENNSRSRKHRTE